MKKRILALALAGTTAFSMFGGLNVFAAIDDYKTGDMYTALEVSYDKTATSVSPDMSAWDTTFDAEEAIENGVSTGTVYVYDFIDSWVDTTKYDMSSIENALTDDDATALITILASKSGKDADTVKPETGYGSYASFRRAIVTAYEKFLKGVVNPGDVKDIEEYGFDDLLDDIPTISSEYLAKTSSELIGVMEMYNTYIEYVTLEGTDSISSEIEALIETLSARDADEFKSATQAKYFLADLEALEEAYADADTFTELTAVKNDLKTLSTKYDSKGADKTDLKAALLSMFDGATITYIKGLEGNKYPATDPALYTKADYDTKATDDAYDVFCSTFTASLDVYEAASSKSFQTDVDIATEKLLDAASALEAVTAPKTWELVKLQELYDEAATKQECDWKATQWKNLTAAMAKAEAVLESSAPGSAKTTAAINSLESALAALTKTNQATVKASDKKALYNAIAAAEKALEDLSASTSPAQFYALKGAVSDAKDLYDTYGKTLAASTLKDTTKNSDVYAAIEALDAAMDYSAVTLGWSKNAAGKWIYGTADGYLANGWNKLGGTWYYFNADGTAKQSEWMQEDGTWYWFTSNCNAARGWAKVDGNWYYFNDGCKMMTGWVKVAGSWYYLAPSGKMMTGWVEVNGKWYYLSKEANAVGQMLYNTTVDGYKLGADGAWVK